MEIRLEMGYWFVNDEYFIIQSFGRYEIYNYGDDEAIARELFSSESFEECLVWIWNS
mgnify:CR=1 FL=1